MYVIGLDVGTTGTKALAVDESGRTASSSYRSYPTRLTSGDDGSVTQKAEEWWEAVVTTVREVALAVGRENVAAIGLSTQGASMLATDAEGRPLTDVMTWMDSRATREVEYLDGAVGTEKIYRKCGWPLTPAGDAAKILWLKNNMPDVFDKAYCFPSTVEFINKKLTGRFVTDPTNAAIRQLFNIEEGKWDREILNAIGITEERLPEVAQTGALVGTLTEDAANALGLDKNVKVFCGAHDQYCASVGAGAVTPGDMMLATGTAWVILGITDSLLYTDNRICPGIHPSKGAFGAMASLVSAGSALEWYKAQIGGSYREMDEAASTRRESGANLFVLPYVAGAGFPHNKPDAAGTVHGFRVGNDKYDIALAVMEGVAFEARTVIEEFAANGMKIERLMMTGGAARSDLWSKIVRDVTGCEVVRPTEPETCCMGAAYLALVSLGIYSDLADCAGKLTSSSPLEGPDPDAVSFYNEKYKKYCKLRETLLALNV